MVEAQVRITLGLEVDAIKEYWTGMDFVEDLRSICHAWKPNRQTFFSSLVGILIGASNTLETSTVQNLAQMNRPNIYDR